MAYLLVLWPCEYLVLRWCSSQANSRSRQGSRPLEGRQHSPVRRTEIQHLRHELQAGAQKTTGFLLRSEAGLRRHGVSKDSWSSSVYHIHTIHPEAFQATAHLTMSHQQIMHRSSQPPSKRNSGCPGVDKAASKDRGEVGSSPESLQGCQAQTDIPGTAIDKRSQKQREAHAGTRCLGGEWLP